MDLAFDELEGGGSGRGSLLSGATALHIAVKNGHSALVKVLVEAGAGINARTTDLDEQQSPVYQSPIHVAVLNHRYTSHAAAHGGGVARHLECGSRHH
jgi:hypothetical protein